MCYWSLTKREIDETFFFFFKKDNFPRNSKIEPLLNETFKISVLLNIGSLISVKKSSPYFIKPALRQKY